MKRFVMVVLSLLWAIPVMGCEKIEEVAIRNESGPFDLQPTKLDAARFIAERLGAMCMKAVAKDGIGFISYKFTEEVRGNAMENIKKDSDRGAVLSIAAIFAPAIATIVGATANEVYIANRESRTQAVMTVTLKLKTASGNENPGAKGVGEEHFSYGGVGATEKASSEALTKALADLQANLLKR